MKLSACYGISCQEASRGTSASRTQREPPSSPPLGPDRRYSAAMAGNCCGCSLPYLSTRSRPIRAASSRVSQDHSAPRARMATQTVPPCTCSSTVNAPVCDIGLSTSETGLPGTRPKHRAARWPFRHVNVNRQSTTSFSRSRESVCRASFARFSRVTATKKSAIAPQKSQNGSNHTTACAFGHSLQRA